MILNLGCGELILDNATNVDRYQGPGIDVVHDLDVFPWPFKDEEFSEALALDIFEHVDHPLEFMAELWRVLKPGSPVRLRTTKWDAEQGYADPTHKRWLTTHSFDYWIPGTEFHRKYGAGYAEGRHFHMADPGVWQDGMELEWRLIRGDRCSGAC